VHGGLDASAVAPPIQGVDPASNCGFVAAQPHAIGNITLVIGAQPNSIDFDHFFRARARETIIVRSPRFRRAPGDPSHHG